MRSNWLHRARQSASETPVGVVDLLGVLLEPEPEGHGDIEDGSGVLVGRVISNLQSLVVPRAGAKVLVAIVYTNNE